MTQQEMNDIITELETTFKQPVNPKPWTTDGLAFDRYEHTWANSTTQQFETSFGIGLWVNGVLVSTITRVDQWAAFKSVALLFSQVETIGTYTGECLECGRTSVISDGSRLCEACTIYLTTANE